MNERVRGYADAVLDNLKEKDLARAASELEAFATVVAGSDDLRSALDLPTAGPTTRRAIIADLLAKKVSAPVLAVLAYSAQYGPGADFPEDAGQLAQVSAARRSGLVALEIVPLGRRAAIERLAGYVAGALGPVKDERHLGEVEDELFRFMRTVEGNDDLRVALTTAELPVQARHSLVRDLLQRHATPEACRMAAYAVIVGRPRDYLELLGALVDQVATEAQRRVADVRSAAEMSEAERASLAGALTKLTGTPVDVRVTVEPALLGGFVATVGDTLVDASLRHRLAQARDLLAAPVPGTGPGPQGN